MDGDDEKIDAGKLRKICEADAEAESLRYRYDWKDVRSADPQRRAEARRWQDRSLRADGMVMWHAEEASPTLQKLGKAMRAEINRVDKLIAEDRLTDEGAKEHGSIVSPLIDQYNHKFRSLLMRCRPPIG